MQDHTSSPGAIGQWVARIGTWMAPEENPSAVIYGLLTATATNHGGGVYWHVGS